MIENLSELFGKAKKIVKSLQEEVAKHKLEKNKLKVLEKKLTDKSNYKEPRTKVDISLASVVKATLAIIGLIGMTLFVIQIKSIIVLFFISAFLALALDPFVDKMQKYRIPRSIGILFIYLIFIGVIGFVIASFIPILATEIPRLAHAVLEWINSLGIDTSVFQAQINEFQSYLSNIESNLSRESLQAGLDVLSTVGQNAVAIVISVAGGIFSFVMVLVITFFMIVDEDGIKKFLLALFPKRFHGYILEKGARVEKKFGAWVRGQLILMLAVGILTFIALEIAGINYSATLAVLAGLTELLPYVGPLLAFIPAVIIALSQGGLVFAIVVAAIYIGIQQLEGNILVPLVMKKAVGLSPVIVMFAMLVGASFPDTINPIIGIIVAVPIATAIGVFVEDYAGRDK